MLAQAAPDVYADPFTILGFIAPLVGLAAFLLHQRQSAHRLEEEQHEAAMRRIGDWADGLHRDWADGLHRDVPALLRSPLPGEPTMCLLDHRHLPRCRGKAEVYVQFDPDLAAIGAIEPEFVRERVGWYTKRAVAVGWEPVMVMGDSLPVDWVPRNQWVEEDIEPVPRYETRLKWRRSQN